ncbi:MAG: alpha-galactosidase [Actinobacteria bacterium 13_2_20CM_2_72_6]|nr:MAG: alpha-galactosidase [Actinobacteria bacterium 13_2_20CM_2_72_6]
MRPRLKRLSIVLAALSTGAAGVVAGVLAAPDAHASNNGQSIRPAMGWSSWSFIRRDPTAAKIIAQADAMKNSGLADHGYLYVNLDDFFQKCDGNGFVVDGFGRWTVDTAKFPGGIKPVADHVHSLGLKFGLYVTPGIPQNAVTKNTPIEGTSFHAKDIADTSKTEKNYNCKHMYFINYAKPGAQEFVNSWANLYASWGVDYLKIDGVGAADIPDVQAWDKALRQTGRPINFALSNNLPIANATTWANLSNSWRTQGDVECYCSGQPNGVGYPLTRWSSIASRFNSTASWQQFAGPGHWNDYDSMELGSGDQEIQDISGMNKADIRRTQLTLWSMAAAPLLLGTDLTQLTSSNPAAGVSTDKAMLFNDRIIAVDQDGVAAKRIINSGGGQVYSKKEADGSFVVALFNTNTSGSMAVSVNWSQVGFSGSGNVTDLWSGTNTGTVANSYSATLRAGEPRLIRVVPGTGGGGGSTVEAETGALAGSTRLSTCSACSGGQKVGFIGNGAGNFVTVNGVTPSAAGDRTLTITYLLSGSRSFFVSVNGAAAVEVKLTGTSFATPVTTTIPVTLNAGANSIKFFNSSAYAPDLDKISVD